MKPSVYSSSICSLEHATTVLCLSPCQVSTVSGLSLRTARLWGLPHEHMAAAVRGQRPLGVNLEGLVLSLGVRAEFTFYLL